MIMRQIKFRAKSIYTNKWVYGNLRIFGERAYISAVDSHAQSEVLLSTVGQFTGLTDCNGKQIYEGDIIHTRNDNRLIVRYGYKEHIVRLNGVNDSFAAYGWIVENIQNGFTDFLDNECLQCKVIGNIHDNPELIPNQPTEV